VGLITYMRTDSTASATTPSPTSAITSASATAQFPAALAQHLQKQERMRRRPRSHTSHFHGLHAEVVEAYLPEDEMKLYRLIWNPS
jgi:DNA topoisomerase IA